MSTLNKEQVYDTQIAPLVDKIIAVCKAEGISMIAHFELPIPGDETLSCTTKMADGGGNTSPTIKAMLRMTGLQPEHIVGRGGVPR